MGTRRQGSEQRLQRIVDAARACFAEHGFAATTVEAIALRAEVSNGLLYKHFQGKEHLFQAVLDYQGRERRFGLTSDQLSAG